MKTYDKDKLVLEYLTIIQAQDKEIKELRAKVSKLKRDSTVYKGAAIRWKEAYKELNKVSTNSNKIICGLVDKQSVEIEKIIKAYKENM